uniref:Uncharacterized protein n=1 Tax=Romanomermis culicivorax TaxID=13658 RepID=A0A915JHE5_ROMCU
MDRSKTSCDAQGVAKEAVFKENTAFFICKRFVYTKAVKPSPFIYLQADRTLFLYLLSTTEAAVDCHFVSPLVTVSRPVAYPNHHPF